MRLVDLNPEFAIAAENDSRGVGLIFDCPCSCGVRRWIPFANPIGGGESITKQAGGGWKRTGDSMDTLTLSPSILFRRSEGSSGCGWHGWIKNGEVTSC